MKKARVFLLALVILGLLCGCGTAVTQTKDLAREAEAARFAADGSAYIVTESGSTPLDDVSDGYVTPDRSHIVTLTDSGEIFYSDAAMENTVKVCDNAASLSDVRNDGFFYTGENDTTYRVRFGVEESDKLGEGVKYTVAKNTTSVLYATMDGKLFLLGCDTTEALKAGTFDDSVMVEGISDNGSIAIWLLNSGNQYTPVIYNGGDKKTCESYSSYISFFGAEFSKDQKLVVLGSYNSNTIYIAGEGMEAVKVSLPSALFLPVFYSEKGRVRDTNAADITAVFAVVDAESATSLYRITLDGDKERLLTDVWLNDIRNGRLIYTDNDENLYTAEAAAANIEETKISGSVDRVRMVSNGQYVYFTKNAEDDEATLCVYNVAKDSVQKIGSCANAKISVSTDGAEVYFFKDTEEAKGTNVSYGDLYRWTYSEKEAESVKLASDVLTDSLSSFLASGEIDKDNFTFERYNGTVSNGGEEKVSYDLVRVRGGKTEKEQSELIRGKYTKQETEAPAAARPTEAPAEAPAEEVY